MFCANCGKQIPDGSRFCPNCGAQAGPLPEEQQAMQRQQYNQQQFNQQARQGQPRQGEAQWTARTTTAAAKAGKGGFLVRLGIGIAAALVIFIGASMFLGGGDDSGLGETGKTVSTKTGSAQASMPDPSAVISLRDFDWFYTPKSYDSSGDVPVNEAYSPTGVWKVTIMRKPDKKSSYRKELYLLDLQVEGRPRVIGSEPGAVDVYGFQGFKNSDEAKEAGFDKNNTAGDLISALQEGDGTLPCTGTLVLLLVEDENGKMLQPGKENLIDVTGIYSPKRAILRLKDGKGNEYGTHAFVKSGDEEHCEGAYTSGRKDPALGGVIGMCREIE